MKIFHYLFRMIMWIIDMTLGISTAITGLILGFISTNKTIEKYVNRIDKES